MLKKIKNLIVFGTRPEAIKMAPLYIKFRDEFFDTFETRLCITAQHRQMLDQVLDFFDITPDYDLDIMRQNQDLYSLTSDIILNTKPVLDDFKPDYVYVHGDTTTSSAVALAAFYAMIKVCHVEAGLRTHDKYSPFPEEINRQLTARLADLHFAPTIKSRDNLLAENIAEQAILVTGNTVIDALNYSVAKIQAYHSSELELVKELCQGDSKIILVTGHRRENHGEGFLNICKALKTVASQNEEVTIVYPVHLNPNVRRPVFELLNDVKNIHLIEPLSYPSFVWLMNKSYLIITDSGGIQEEAPSLGKPVLVIRDTTERPEAVEAGTVILVGTSTGQIVKQTQRLIEDDATYQNMSRLINPYGDGKACERIINHIISLQNFVH
jgi:UDP-N-acetylglucosamine 2-epimerase (non-hydrolysing)